MIIPQGKRSFIRLIRRKGQVCDVYQKGEILYVIHTSGVIEMIDLQQGKSILKNGHLKKVCKARRFMLFIDSDNEIWVYPIRKVMGIVPFHSAEWQVETI